MLVEERSNIRVEQVAIASQFLRRMVIADIYLPLNVHGSELNLLLINDGQDMEELSFSSLLNGLMETGSIEPLLCVGIHTNKNRLQEYGTAGVPDFAGRGAKAGAYQDFILEELLPYLHNNYAPAGFKQKGYCGFSLGGLSAIHTTINHGEVFTVCGVFSGSLWWRTRDLADGYLEDRDRIIHNQVRSATYTPGQRFYFTTGSLDETADRNNNGIIDSIDDTLDLIKELKAKGYTERDIHYINFEDGKHDLPTWKRAFPAFLLWAYRKEVGGESC